MKKKLWIALLVGFLILAHPLFGQQPDPFTQVQLRSRIVLNSPASKAETIGLAIAADFTIGCTAALFKKQGIKGCLKKGIPQALGGGFEQLSLHLASQKGQYGWAKLVQSFGSSLKYNSRHDEKWWCGYGTDYLWVHVRYDFCDKQNRFQYHLRLGQVATTVYGAIRGDKFQWTESFRLGIPYFTTKRPMEGLAQTRLGTILAKDKWYNHTVPLVRFAMREHFKTHEGAHTLQYYPAQQCHDVDRLVWGGCSKKTIPNCRSRCASAKTSAKCCSPWDAKTVPTNWRSESTKAASGCLFRKNLETTLPSCKQFFACRRIFLFSVAGIHGLLGHGWRRKENPPKL